MRVRLRIALRLLRRGDNVTVMGKTLSRPGAGNLATGSAFGAWWKRARRDVLRNRYIYLMLLPVLAYYLIFHYGPMYGAVIAFQDFNPLKGILGSKWIGL